jgi:uncharacterized protein YprB with RNaseH-like and TPR domain
MSLRDRIGRLTGETPVPDQYRTRQEKIDELRRKLDRALKPRERNRPSGLSPTRRQAAALEHVVIGEEARTSHGSFYVSRSSLEPSDTHGNSRICDLACLGMEAASFFSGPRLPKEASIDDGLFLDTETTGLVGGTGTFPFLIGLGWFESGSFVTCQLFARDFSEENAMLRYLGEIASMKRFLVTFNGKAYDLNLLATRFILNHCEDTLTALPHIDLLHPSRRILAHRLENARLATIEACVLGLERDGDVPGSEIPQRYFDWLRSRDGTVLEDVFKHNRQDIVSMAALLKYLADLMEEGETGRKHHGDLLKLAGLIHERGDSERAGRIFEMLSLSHYGEVAASARQSLSLMHKRARRWEEALAIWQELLDSDAHSFFAVEELAKFYEHNTREFGKAFELVQSFLDRARLSETERDAAGHRLRRLQRKLSASSANEGKE